MPIKNAGTATMRFREGIKVEGDNAHGSANQLVVTGSISVMEPTASGTTATLQSTANPTTSETTPSDWSYFSGLTNNSHSSSFEPRNPIQAIPIDGGGTWNSEIYAFEGSGVVNGVDSMRILAHKNTISGDSRLEFMLIGAGAFNSDHTQPHVAGDIKRPGFPNPTVFPNHTMGFNGFNWSGGSSDPLRDIKVMVATTGYGATDDWTQVGSVTYHAHPPGHPNSGTRNLNQHQFESF